MFKLMGKKLFTILIPPPPPYHHLITDVWFSYSSGTTYSCVGVYHAVTGNVDILETQEKHQCIPSVVAFRHVSIYLRAQWLSGRVLDSRPRGRGFKPHQHQFVVSLSKNINSSLVLVQPRKTRPFITEKLLIGHKESNQTNIFKNNSYTAK